MFEGKFDVALCTNKLDLRLARRAYLNIQLSKLMPLARILLAPANNRKLKKIHDSGEETDYFYKGLVRGTFKVPRSEVASGRTGAAQRMWVMFLDKWASVLLPGLRFLADATGLLGDGSPFAAKSVRADNTVHLVKCRDNLVEQSKAICEYAGTIFAGPVLVHRDGNLYAAQVKDNKTAFFQRSKTVDLFPSAAKWLKGLITDLLMAAEACGEAIEVLVAKRLLFRYDAQ
jgi:hypothetical protein